jgi:hypothetical protein
MSRTPIALAAASVAALAAFAGTAAAQTTSKSSSTNSCPSQQTVMTSDWYGSTKGYLCAQEYHSGERSIGAGKTDTFSTSTNVAYFPQYYCWDTSDDKEFTYAHAEIFGSGSVSATNWGTGSHKWGAGYFYTLGAGTVTGWSNGCDYSSAVWTDTPDLLRITGITANNLPDNGQSKAGVKYTVSVTSTPSQYTGGQIVVLEDNGTAVAQSTFDANGNATITWYPAKMGARNIQVAWPGTSAVLGNITDAYTVNVAGGLAATIEPTVKDNGNGTATATVDLDSTPDPFPTGATLVLVDANAKNPKTGAPPNPVAQVAVPTQASGTTTASIPVTFRYAGGQSFKLLAIVQDSSGKTIAQSYVAPFQAPTVLTPTFPTSTIYPSFMSGGNEVCQWVVIPTTIAPATATGGISVTTSPASGTTTSTTYPSNGSANVQWCPPTSPGTYTVTVNYAGDSTSKPASVSTQMTLPASGGPAISLSNVKATSSTKCTATVNVSGGTNGAAVKLLSIVGIAPTTVGSGTLSGGAATFSFGCQMGFNYTLVGQYQGQSQAFFSAPRTYSFQYQPSTQPPGWSAVKSTAPMPALATSPGRSAQMSREAAGATATQRRKPAPKGNPGIARAGTLTPVNIGVSSRSRKIRVTSSRRSVSLTCPVGSYPLNANAASRGPDTDFSVSFSGRRATLTSGSANIGQPMTASVTCRATGTPAQMVGPMGFGTRGGDTLRSAVSNGTIFAGPGPDRIRATGSRSVAWGGFGHDRIAIAGRNSSAAGGPGRDRLVAIGPGRKLLWGGEGPDTLVGGPGATLINAQDGRGGDRVICRSSSNRVMLDAGDSTTGPCTVVAAG